MLMLHKKSVSQLLVVTLSKEKKTTSRSFVSSASNVLLKAFSIAFLFNAPIIVQINKCFENFPLLKVSGCSVTSESMGARTHTPLTHITNKDETLAVCPEDLQLTLWAIALGSLGPIKVFIAFLLCQNMQRNATSMTTQAIAAGPQYLKQKNLCCHCQTVSSKFVFVTLRRKNIKEQLVFAALSQNTLTDTVSNSKLGAKGCILTKLGCCTGKRMIKQLCVAKTIFIQHCCNAIERITKCIFKEM